MEKLLTEARSSSNKEWRGDAKQPMSTIQTMPTQTRPRQTRPAHTSPREPAPSTHRLTRRAAQRERDALRRLRRAHGITLQQLSQSTGKSKSLLSDIERGLANATTGDVQALRAAVRHILIRSETKQ
jgi:ribosome-binding protein aMBF1 (putative translation factor)